MLLVSVLLFSCEDPQVPEVPQADFESQLVDVNIYASTLTQTKVTYEPNADNTELEFSWESGDELSFIVPDVEDNTNQKFTAQNSEQSSVLSGQLFSWQGAKTLYALYPYSQNGYTFDQTSNTIFYDNSSQQIYANAGTSYPNGLMVAVAANSMVESEDNFNIPDIRLRQVMSFLELDLKDVPQDETIFKIGLESESDVFVVSANIDPADGSITPVSYASSVSARYIDATSGTASLSFAVLPCDLSGTPLILTISTQNSQGQILTYSYPLESGVNFAQNTFLSNPAGALSLTEDFVVSEPTLQDLYLADFVEGFIPDGTTWKILDESATNEDFAGLRALLVEDFVVSLQFPNMLEIPKEAFMDCEASFTFSAQSATFIDDYAFQNCSKLNLLSLPEIATIGSYAFGFCTSLLDVSLPKATEIRDYAFAECTSLISLSLPKATKVGDYSFNDCSNLVSVSIEDEVVIGEYAFSDCSLLSELLLPKATLIERDAFYSCTSLATVSLPEVTEISDGVFNCCYSLESVSIPKALSIGAFAFSSCQLLVSVSLPEVTRVDRYAFANCIELSSISLPSLTEISGGAVFQSCTSLVSVSLPSVTEIKCLKYEEPAVFGNCSSLTDIELATNENCVITVLGEDVFGGLEGNFSLNIGSANSELVSGNTLTVTSNKYGTQSYTFKEIYFDGNKPDPDPDPELEDPFTVDITSVTSSSIFANITPNNNYTGTWYVGSIKKSQFEDTSGDGLSGDAQSLAESFMYLECDIYGTDLSVVDYKYVFEGTCQDVDLLAGWGGAEGTEYAIVIFGMNAAGEILTDVTLVTATTEDIALSDFTIDCQFSNVTSSSVNYAIYPSDQETYYVYSFYTGINEYFEQGVTQDDLFEMVMENNTDGGSINVSMGDLVEYNGQPLTLTDLPASTEIFFVGFSLYISEGSVTGRCCDAQISSFTTPANSSAQTQNSWSSVESAFKVVDYIAPRSLQTQFKSTRVKKFIKK